VKEKKKKNNKWEEKAKEVRRERERENEVYEIINKERKRRKRVNKGIKSEEWKEYCMSMLGGVKDRVLRGEKKECKGNGGGGNQ